METHSLLIVVFIVSRDNDMYERCGIISSIKDGLTVTLTEIGSLLFDQKKHGLLQCYNMK